MMSSIASGLARAAVSAVVLVTACNLAGCGKSKDNQMAYDVCMVAAKKDPRLAKATFADMNGSNIQASTGDADIRVNVPYELDGKKSLYQCIAAKQVDGSYKVSF